MKDKFSMLKVLFRILFMSSLLFGCGKNNDDNSSASSADESASGAAASAVGGALSSSNTNGTQALFSTPVNKQSHKYWEFFAPSKAFAANSCPTFLTTGTGCAASGSNMWLTYSSCTFNGAATWTGVQKIAMSSGTANCGTFPYPGTSGTLQRQFVSASASNLPSSVSLLTTNGTVIIDNSSSNLGNFDNQTITPILNGGYGAAITFNSSGARSSITLAHRTYITGVFDHSVTGNLNINESSGATSRVVSGTVTVYHNRARVVGTSVFTAVGHQDSCCTPTSGKITTTFSAGANVSPTAIGDLLVGKSESLTFNGCGTAVYTAVNGNTSNVTIRRCF